VSAELITIISGSACYSTGGVHSQAWSTSGIGLGSKSGRGLVGEELITQHRCRQSRTCPIGAVAHPDCFTARNIN
jgi:hypothetical protein